MIVALPSEELCSQLIRTYSTGRRVDIEPGITEVEVVGWVWNATEYLSRPKMYIGIVEEQGAIFGFELVTTPTQHLTWSRPLQDTVDTRDKQFLTDVLESFCITGRTTKLYAEFDGASTSSMSFTDDVGLTSFDIRLDKRCAVAERSRQVGSHILKWSLAESRPYATCSRLFCSRPLQRIVIGVNNVHDVFQGPIPNTP
jgi:hypothetical protein